MKRERERKTGERKRETKGREREKKAYDQEGVREKIHVEHSLHACILSLDAV